MESDTNRRRVLKYAAAAMAGGGAVAVTVPFFGSLGLSSDKPAPHLDINIEKLKDGQMLSVAWMNAPIYVVKRGSGILKSLDLENPELLDPKSEDSNQPDLARNNYRSLRPDVFVAWGMCTHLGCSVSHNPPDTNSLIDEDFNRGMYSCACHGAIYDLAGRVFKRSPAPRNLDVPHYEFVDES